MAKFIIDPEERTFEYIDNPDLRFSPTRVMTDTEIHNLIQLLKMEQYQRQPVPSGDFLTYFD